MLVQGLDPHGLVSDIQEQLTSTRNHEFPVIGSLIEFSGKR